MIFIMLLYNNNIQISVKIHVHQNLIVVLQYGWFFDNSIKTFNLHEDSLIKEIVYEFFGEFFFKASLHF